MKVKNNLQQSLATLISLVNSGAHEEIKKMISPKAACIKSEDINGFIGQFKTEVNSVDSATATDECKITDLA